MINPKIICKGQDSAEQKAKCRCDINPWAAPGPTEGGGIIAEI